jgi:sigma-B regulation protein RsbU (phosphoserine phosphatase)
MTIRRQMILLIALPTLVIYLVVLGVTAFYAYQAARAAVEREMTRLASNFAARFDGHLREAARIAETTARSMEAVHSVSDDEIYELLSRNVMQTDLVYGACLAFEPGTRRPAGTLFAPYVCRAPDGLRRMNIDSSVYDWYHDPQYTWFTRPKKINRSVWSDPYFDEGAGGILMSTYSAPFRPGGSFGGVNTVDIDLPRLRDTVGRDFDRELDFVILTADGRFVFDPEASRIMSKTIFEVASESANPPLATLARQVLSGVPGVGTIDRWDTAEPQFVFYAPIQSADWVFACRVPENAIMADVRTRAAWSAAALALTLALIISCIFFVSRRIAAPIAGLRNKVMQVAAGDLDARIEDTGHAEEIQDLAQSFNRMTADLRNHIERLKDETTARQRIVRDLEIARQIQRSLLPVAKPNLPTHEIVGWTQPADQTGGDYYDWQMLADGRVIITLADVSGHGVGPAIVTAVCRAYARASVASMQQFAPMIDQLNNLLVADLSGGRFVTLAAVLVDPRTDLIELISAGHGPVLHYVAAEHRLVEIDSNNVPLGVMSGAAYHPAVQRHLARGDALILLTDGFHEWADTRGQLFGMDRLRETVLDLARLPSDRIIAELYRRIHEFAQGAPQMDDVTAVIVKRLENVGQPRSAAIGGIARGAQ